MAEIGVIHLGLKGEASPKKGDGAPCVGSISGLTLNSFTCTVGDKKETYPDIGSGDQKKQVKDPAEWLKGTGWTVALDGDKKPTGFSRQGRFEALHAEVDFEASCECAGDSAKSRKRKFRCSIDYDRSGTGGPKFKIVELDDSGKPKAEDKELTPKGDQKEEQPQGEDGPTLFHVTQVSEAVIGCLCDLDRPCHVSLTLTYTYGIK